MEILSRISKGSKMDQIYIPKNRMGGGIGDYVVIKLVSSEEQRKIPAKPFLYGLSKIEPIKIEIINKILSILADKSLENVIITGSFLEKGFNFNDIDILVVSEEQNLGKKEKIESKIINMIGLKPHIIIISKKALISGLETDPIYENMISRCVSRERIIFNYNRKIMPQLLDLQVLKFSGL
jgi:predicted nucleotidyltransferase